MGSWGSWMPGPGLPRAVLAHPQAGPGPSGLATGPGSQSSWLWGWGTPELVLVHWWQKLGPTVAGCEARGPGADASLLVGGVTSRYNWLLSMGWIGAHCLVARAVSQH